MINKKNIEKLTKFLIYATFFVPLVVLPSSYIFPFIVPKILLFRTLVELLIGCYVLLLIINWHEYKPKLNPINIAVLLFFLSFAISTFVGTDPYHSFWDNHERMLGLFTVFHYVSFYFICTSVFKDWKEWRKALLWFLGAGSIVMFIALLQKFSPELLLNRGSTRVSSTLGNPIYVSGYGMFLFFVSMLLVFKEKNKVWRYIEVALGILAIIGLFGGGSRGPMLGWLAGIGLISILYAIFLKENKKVRSALWVMIGVGVVILLFLFINRQSDFVKDINILNRTLNTSLQDVKDSPRWIAWGIAIEAWQERPLFGWGPNNYFYAFNKYYKSELLEHGYGETWFDNAHNVVMNTIAVQGGFGIFVYLSLFGVSWIYLGVRYKNEELDKHVFIVGSAFLLAHLIQNITVFENPTSYLCLMFWLAMVASTPPSINSIESDTKESSSDKNIGSGSIITIILAVFVVVFIFNVQPSKANKKSLEAIRVVNQNPIEGIEIAKEALNFNSPHIDDIRSDLSRSINQIVSEYNEKIGIENSNKMIDLVYSELRKNLELHPLDIRNQLSLAQITQLKASLNQDMNSLFEAELLLEDALSKSPKRQQIIYMLATVKAQLGKVNESVALLESVLEDNYKIGESYWRLGSMFLSIGENGKALEIANLGLGNSEISIDENGKSILLNIVNVVNQNK